jgi:hypothetical protein
MTKMVALFFIAVISSAGATAYGPHRWAVIAAGPKFRQRRIFDRIPEETRRSASRSSAGGTRHDARAVMYDGLRHKKTIPHQRSVSTLPRSAYRTCPLPYVVYDLATARLSNVSAALLKGFQVFPAAKEKRIGARSEKRSGHDGRGSFSP